MAEATPLSPELSRSVWALARSLVAAAPPWSLYPPDPPAVHTSLDRPGRAVRETPVKRGVMEAVDRDIADVNPVAHF